MKKIFGQTFMACALLALCATLFANCGDDDEDEYVDGSDGVVTTNAATDLTATTATVSGTVSQDLLTNGSVYTFGVSYGTDEDANSLTKTTSTITGTTFTITLTGLTTETTYYYKAFVKNSNGNYIYGSTRKFTTSGLNLSSGTAIDLGLPSGTKWATCNVGASSPEDYGGYYAWGETSTKDSYTSYNSTTYGLSYSTLKSKGIIDSDGNLTASYDAATVNWGKGWHMPTLTQIKELLNKCTWTWKLQNGVNGYVVTGTNGNSIFLPAAGCRDDTSLYDAGEHGYYWSSAAYSGLSSYVYLGFRTGRYNWYSDDRSDGFSVRPVSE